MRVAVYYSNNDIRIEERPRPRVGRDEILVKIEASGICGTDCLEWYRKSRVPLVLGHEIAGTVVEAGKGVRGFKTGDRVSASHHVPCGKCRFCLDGHETVCDTLRKTNFDPGGFSEFIRIPKINVEKGTYLIPRNLSFEEATFIEPLACVLRGQRRAGWPGIDNSRMACLLEIEIAPVSRCADSAIFRVMGKPHGSLHPILSRLLVEDEVFGRTLARRQTQ